MSYSHKENIAVAIVFSFQKLRHYILMCSTKVVTNSNPLDFWLTQQIISGNYTRWIVILQEFNIEFITPKSNKGSALVELISDFPIGVPGPPVNDDLRDEHLFTITSDDPWYGDILTYLRTHKFDPTSLVMMYSTSSPSLPPHP